MRYPAALALWGCLLCVSLLGLSCRPSEPAQEAPKKPRLVLLYATCTLNKHFIAPYSQDEHTHTPHLERFARESVVFPRHMSEAGQSGVAFASLFSGLQSDGHGIFRHPTALADDIELIGETFRDGGFRVEAWLEHGMASGELNYAQGAENVRSTLFQAQDSDFQALLDDLQTNPQEKALVITNFTVTHGPYQLATLDAYCAQRPEACEIAQDREAFLRYVEFYREAHAFLSYDFPNTAERAGLEGEHLDRLAESVELLYRANTSYLDRLFGEVLGELERRDLLDESVIAFTADHGETLYREGTHFKWTHGYQLAPEVLEVPWIVKAPGVEPRTWQGVTRSIDVFPTLASLAGLDAPTAAGEDLTLALRGEADEPELRAFSHTALLAEPVLESSQKWTLFNTLIPGIDPDLLWVQVRDGDRVVMLRRTLAGKPEPAVFDTAADPLHLVNLFDGENTEHRRLLRELQEYQKRLKTAWHERDMGDGVDHERQKQLLRDLGYIDD